MIGYRYRVGGRVSAEIEQRLVAELRRAVDHCRDAFDAGIRFERAVKHSPELRRLRADVRFIDIPQVVA